MLIGSGVRRISVADAGATQVRAAAAPVAQGA
jgi:hypothetical protein